MYLKHNFLIANLSTEGITDILKIVLSQSKSQIINVCQNPEKNKPEKKNENFHRKNQQKKLVTSCILFTLLDQQAYSSISVKLLLLILDIVTCCKIINTSFKKRRIS